MKESKKGKKTVKEKASESKVSSKKNIFLKIIHKVPKLYYDGAIHFNNKKLSELQKIKDDAHKIYQETHNNKDKDRQKEIKRLENETKDQIKKENSLFDERIDKTISQEIENKQAEVFSLSISLKRDLENIKEQISSSKYNAEHDINRLEKDTDDEISSRKHEIESDLDSRSSHISNLNSSRNEIVSSINEIRRSPDASLSESSYMALVNERYKLTGMINRAESSNTQRLPRDKYYAVKERIEYLDGRIDRAKESKINNERERILQNKLKNIERELNQERREFEGYDQTKRKQFREFVESKNQELKTDIRNRNSELKQELSILEDEYNDKVKEHNAQLDADNAEWDEIKEKEVDKIITRVTKKINDERISKLEDIKTILEKNIEDVPKKIEKEIKALEKKYDAENKIFTEQHTKVKTMKEKRDRYA